MEQGRRNFGRARALCWSLLLILTLLHYSNPVSGDACSDLALNSTLTPTRTTKEVSARFKFGDGRIESKPVCMVGDGGLCMPIGATPFDPYDPDNEPTRLLQYLTKTFPNYTMTLPTLPRDLNFLAQKGKERDFHVRYYDMRMELKSFFCECGNCDWATDYTIPRRYLVCCGDSNKTQPPRRDLFDWPSYQAKYKTLAEEVQEYDEINAACTYTKRLGPLPKRKLEAGWARYQTDPSSPVTFFRICLIQPGFACYPLHGYDFMEFRNFSLKMMGYLPPKLVGNDYENRTNITKGSVEVHHQDVWCDRRLLNWFCSSGSCNKKTDICAPGPRSDGVMEWWKMKKCNKNQGSSLATSTLLIFLPHILFRLMHLLRRHLL